MSNGTLRKRRRTGFFVFEILILLILVIGLFVYAKLYNALDVIGDQALKKENIGVNDGINREVLKGYTNIALIGLDTRPEGNDGDDLNNSDTMMMASINHDTKEVKLVSLYRDTYLNVGNDKYNKANSAYPLGGEERLLTMINKNLDMDIMDYITVNFTSMIHAIDILGGLDDMEIARDEAIHLNNYCRVMAKELDKPFEALPEVAGTYSLSGMQSVAYARIRQGQGLDFRRAARQRLVIDKMVAKAKKANPLTLNKLLNEIVQPEYISSSLSPSEMMKMGLDMLNYKFAEGGQVGFPFKHMWGENVTKAVGMDAVLPVTLEANVIELHKFLYPEAAYTPSATVQEYSNYIINKSGYGEGSIPEHSEDGTIPPLSPAD